MCLVLCAFNLIAQDFELIQFNEQRLQITQVGMLILGVWAIGNMVVNGFLLRKPVSLEQTHFSRMNIFWNLVNLGLAISGYMSAHGSDPALINLIETTNDFNNMGKILLFNAGLDVAYITGGFLMKEMAKNRENKKDLLSGYGKALIWQGGFLLAFDVILFIILQLKNTELNNLLDLLSSDGANLALIFRF
jgi:hypothetical protein